MSRSRTPSSNSAQIRGDIEKGRTGDKRPGFDPAAAPLETDAEAGGDSLGGDAAAQARREEDFAAGVTGGSFASGMQPFDSQRARRPSSAIWIYIALIAVVAVVLLVGSLLV